MANRPNTEFNCLPTMIGSMPHRDPALAVATVARYLRDIPAWPQLLRRSFQENMYAQLSEGFPGIVVADERIWVDRSRVDPADMERIYSAFLNDDVSKLAISPNYAAGLYEFLESKNLTARAVKGQITGPVTWGTTILDETKKPILYGETLGDLVPKMLKLRAGWMEQQLRRLNPNTIIFVDEPAMSAFGSVALSLSKEKVITLMDEVFAGIHGLRGSHCCGNTDWPVLMATQVDIISFDAYSYASSLALYPAEVRAFLGRGGAVAWGIVPNTPEALAQETVASLRDRLDAAMEPFTKKGIPIRQLRAQALLTPACGLAPLAEEGAEQALRLLAELSEYIRKRYI